MILLQQFRVARMELSISFAQLVVQGIRGMADLVVAQTVYETEHAHIRRRGVFLAYCVITNIIGEHPVPLPGKSLLSSAAGYTCGSGGS